MPGDIVLTSSNSASGMFVKVGTCSNISHAMLALMPGQFIQATGGGGVHIATFRQAMLGTDSAEVYRTKLTPAQLNAIIKNALSHLGKDYDFVEVVGGAEYARTLPATTTLPNMVPVIGPIVSCVAQAAVATNRLYNLKCGNRAKIFCSELVVAAYQAAGLLGGRNASSYSPRSLSALPGFRKVGTLDPSPAAHMPPPP